MLTPRTEVDERHPRVESVGFHANGQVARIAVPAGTTVSTPLGPMPAELLTFHPEGTVRRVFPSAGRLSVEWTEQQEREVVPVLRLQTPVGLLEGRFISIHWYRDGALRSVTLWPGETLVVETPIGAMAIRQGLAFAEDGSLASVEPARPTAVSTPLGEMTAFDPNPIGLHADANSLEFDPAGNIASLVTTTATLVATLEDGNVERFVPNQASGESCDEGCGAPAALRVSFEGSDVRLRLGARELRVPASSVTVSRPKDGRRHLPFVG